MIENNNTNNQKKYHNEKKKKNERFDLLHKTIFKNNKKINKFYFVLNKTKLESFT